MNREGKLPREFESLTLQVPDSKIKFRLLWLELEAYLCGFGPFNSKMLKQHYEAELWIFGPQDYEFCFNEVWLTFYELDPEFLKRYIKRKFEMRFENWRNNAQSTVPDGRGRQGDEDCGTCFIEGDNWSILAEYFFD